MSSPILTPRPFTPELLSPAGSLKNMRYAFAYGADAVYAGQPRYSLRVRNNEFDLDNLQIGINEAHAQNNFLYVKCNDVSIVLFIFCLTCQFFCMSSCTYMNFVVMRVVACKSLCIHRLCICVSSSVRFTLCVFY